MGGSLPHLCLLIICVGRTCVGASGGLEPVGPAKGDPEGYQVSQQRRCHLQQWD